MRKPKKKCNHDPSKPFDGILPFDYQFDGLYVCSQCGHSYDDGR